jgi:hypothetical protein
MINRTIMRSSIVAGLDAEESSINRSDCLHVTHPPHPGVE